MIWATVGVVLGIALTVISADKFVEGGGSEPRLTARHESFRYRSNHSLNRDICAGTPRLRCRGL